MSTQLRPDGIKFPGNDAIQNKPVITVDNQHPSTNGNVEINLSSIQQRMNLIQSRIDAIKSNNGGS